MIEGFCHFNSIVSPEVKLLSVQTIENVSKASRNVENYASSGFTFRYQEQFTSTRNRFLIWLIFVSLLSYCFRKVHTEFLELAEYSLDLNLSQNSIQIRFPSNIFPSIAIFEKDFGTKTYLNALF